jgi:glutathione S-transferase
MRWLGCSSNPIMRGMELYILPFASSFAAHVALLEAGLPYTISVLDRRSQRLDDGRDYRAITEKATVPALKLSDNTVLTESAAVLQYIADTVPESNLAPRPSTRERYQLVEWLNFVTTELHKKHLWMIFSLKTTPEMKDWARASIPPLLDLVDRHLQTRDFVLGEHFTVADAYLFWTLLVAPHGGVPLDKWPAINAYVARLRERPSIAKAISIEAPLYAKEQKAA